MVYTMGTGNGKIIGGSTDNVEISNEIRAPPVDLY